MNRRRFLAASIVVVAAAPSASAQQGSKVARIGFVEAGARSVNRNFIDTFRQGLADLGWVEGQNIAIYDRWAEGRPERFPTLLADLIQLNVDLILQASSPGALAAKNATKTIPIVFVGV